MKCSVSQNCNDYHLVFDNQSAKLALFCNVHKTTYALIIVFDGPCVWPGQDTHSIFHAIDRLMGLELVY